MLTRHVTNALAAYAERQLDAASHQRVEAHLALCGRCRAELERVRRGIAFASELEAEPMPLFAAARVRAAVTSGDPVDAGARRRWARLARAAAGAAATAVVALFAVWQINRPWAEVRAADVGLAFEREALQIHERVRAGSPMQMSGMDERRIRQWLAEQRAPIASIAVDRAAGERRRFVPRGVTIERVAGARASVLAYEIDGRPVTLVLAAQADVPDAPEAAWLSKRIAHRRTAEGRNTLTWSTGGQTYVLVSELDALGQRACFMCHTDARFRRVIDRLTLTR